MTGAKSAPSESWPRASLCAGNQGLSWSWNVVKGSWKTRSINCSLESRVSGGSCTEQMQPASQDLSQETPWLGDCVCNFSSCTARQKLHVIGLWVKWLGGGNRNTRKQRGTQKDRGRVYKILFQMSMQIKIPKSRSKINAKKTGEINVWGMCSLRIWNENNCN